jgi:DNA adenine methylase
MRYMGGKSRIGKEIVQAIIADGAPRDRWFEPFVGGANITVHAAPVFGKCLGMDAHPDLILMWKKVVEECWSPPHTVTREQYNELRHAEPSALRGFVGFGCSFGGKWFGGYAKDHITGRSSALESTSAVTKQGSVFVKHGVQFQHGLFGSRPPAAGTVLYCDPPYEGTTTYSTDPFDHNMFYKKLVEYAVGGAWVYVSEYAVPDWVPARLMWSKETQVSVGLDNSKRSEERLYRIKG